MPPRLSFCPAATAPPGGAARRRPCVQLWWVPGSFQVLSIFSASPLCPVLSSPQASLTSSGLRSSSPSLAPPLLLLSPLMLLPSPDLPPVFLSQVTCDFPPCSSHPHTPSSPVFPASSVPSSGVQGAWPDPDITPVPLLSSPDLDSLCDPAAPVLSNPFPRPSPPRSASFPPPPLAAPPGTAAPAAACP